MITQLIMNQYQVKTHRGVPQPPQAMKVPRLWAGFQVPEDLATARHVQRVKLMPGPREIELIAGMNRMGENIHRGSVKRSRMQRSLIAERPLRKDRSQTQIRLVNGVIIARSE